MILNNISALGSNVDAMILVNIDTTIGDTTYHAGEPFTFLHNISANIDSISVSPQTSVTTPSNKGMQLVDAINYINRLTLNGVPMTKKIKSLFFNQVATRYDIDWIQVLDSPMKLEHAPVKIFLYKDGVLLPDDSYTCEDQWLRINNYDGEPGYMCAYKYADEDLWQFVTTNYPYFTVILYAWGNQNGKTVEQRIIFEKVSLMPQTGFTFDASVQNNVSLVFGVIEPEKTVSVKI